MGNSKTIFVNRFFYPDETATSQILTDLCFHLAAENREIHVLTSSRCHGRQGRLQRHEVRNGVKIWRVRSSSFGRNGSMVGRIVDYLAFYPFAFLQLLRLCERGDVVVVKTDPPLISLFAWIVAKLKGARLINWLQDLYPEVAIRLGMRALRGPVGNVLISLRNYALAGADANIVIGARMADRLNSMGIKSEKTFLIPNWSSEEAAEPISTMQSKTRRGWAIEDDVFVVAYSGNFGRAHESETILGAAKLLRYRSDICFLFVGGGHESQNLQSAVNSLNLPNFLFKPHQPRDQLSDSLSAADAHWLSLRPELEGLIVPSKFYGIVSAGRAVIAVTDPDGEIARLVKESDCGLVVKPGDCQALAEAISALADDRDRCRDMGFRARQAADQTYTRRLALARWNSILDKVVGVGEEAATTNTLEAAAGVDPLQPLIEEVQALQQQSELRSHSER